MTRIGPILGRLNNDINVTPLVDVCLVLLIIFMLVAPYLVPGHPVQMPSALNPQAVKDADRAVTIAVEANGTLYLENDPVSLERLQKELGLSLDQGAVPVRIQGDRRVTFGPVKGVLAAVNKAGSKEVQLLVSHVDEKGRPVASPATEP